MKFLNTGLKIIPAILIALLFLTGTMSLPETLTKTDIPVVPGSVELPKNRLVFSSSTSVDALEYEGVASFETQILELKSEKPVIEVYNTTCMLFTLSVSYTPFEADNTVNNDIKLALNNKNGSMQDVHGNIYEVFEPGVVKPLFTSRNNESLTTIPWGAENNDLLKVFLPSYRHDLNNKPVKTVLTWHLEVTPSGELVHLWDEWTIYTVVGATHEKSRSCTKCGYKENESHPEAAHQSPWASGGDGCRRLCEFSGCGIQTTTHPIRHSSWSLSGSNCITTCTTCHRQTQFHSTLWNWTSDTDNHWEKCNGANYTCTMTRSLNRHNLLWTSDTSNHWQFCDHANCNYKTPVVPHTLDNWLQNDTQCWQSCSFSSCLYETIRNTHQWGTWHSINGFYHFANCQNCGIHSGNRGHVAVSSYYSDPGPQYLGYADLVHCHTTQRCRDCLLPLSHWKETEPAPSHTWCVFNSQNRCVGSVITSSPPVLVSGARGCGKVINPAAEPPHSTRNLRVP